MGRRSVVNGGTDLAWSADVDGMKSAPVATPKLNSAGAAPREPLTACPDCKGSIVGIATGHCPACGVNIISAIRRHESNHSVRVEGAARYRRALVLALLAYALLAAVLFIGGDPGDAAWFVKRQVFFVPIACGLWWVLCTLWIGFDQPLVLSFVRIAAITAVADTVGFFMWWVPILFFNQLAVALAFVVLMLQWMDDLEPQEAVVTGFLMGAVRYMVHIGLAQGEAA